MVTLAVTLTVPAWMGVTEAVPATPGDTIGVTEAPSRAEITVPVLAPSPAAMAVAWACACLAAKRLYRLDLEIQARMNLREQP